MFDAAYFRSQLAAQAQAAGPKPTVEIHLLTGQGHRVRSVIEAADGYVVLDVYQRRSEVTGANTAWEGGAAPDTGVATETHRAVVSYESITQVVITATESSETTRIGFGARTSR